MKLNSPQDIGGLIKARRKELGLTLEDLNLMTGISVSALSKIERYPELKRFENIFTILTTLDLKISIEEK